MLINKKNKKFKIKHFKNYIILKEKALLINQKVILKNLKLIK